MFRFRLCAYRLNYNVKRQMVFLGGIYGNRFFSTDWPGDIWFVLLQGILKLLFVKGFIFPRIPILRVDAHIRLTNIADGAFDGLRRQVYHDMVTNLIVRGRFLHNGGSIELLFFVQLTDAEQRLFAEDGIAVVEHFYILQADRLQHEVDMLYDKLPSIKLNLRTQRQIIFFSQILGLMMMRVIFVQARQIDAVALGPQLFSFGCPPFRGKTGNIDTSESIFLCEQPVGQEPGDGMGILAVEQVEAAQLKADQRVPVQRFQRRIFGGRVIVQHGKLLLGLLHGGTKLLFVFGKIAVRLDHQIDVLLDLTPTEKRFLMAGIVFKLQTVPAVGHKAAAAVEIFVGAAADAILLCQRFSADFTVLLSSVQFNDPLFSTSEHRSLLTQFVLDLCLRQRKSGGRFLVLRSVDYLDLFCFGGDGRIQKA